MAELTCKEAAIKLVALDISSLPIRPNPDKSPAFGAPNEEPTWSHLQIRRPTSDEIDRYFSNGAWIAIATGPGSGNLEVIDFDVPEWFPIWKELNDPEILKRLLIIQSPSGGFHCYYRANRIGDNKTLAYQANDEIGIETRGNGGYIVCPPSPGYKAIQGSFGAIPVLTAIEREELLATACQLNEGSISTVKPKKKLKGDSNANMERWAESFDVESYMASKGWERHSQNGRNIYFRRPRADKKRVKGASWNGEVFYVFTSNAAPLKMAHGYGKWALVTEMDYDGDFAESAKALFPSSKPQKHTQQKPFETRIQGEPDPLDATVPDDPELRPLIIQTLSYNGVFEPVKVDHVLFPYLQIGKSHLWDADGGTHKTGAMIAISASLTKGINPLTLKACEPINVLYLHKGEDLSEELETVFRANGGDSSKIHYGLEPLLVLDEKGIEIIGNTIVDKNITLLVLDAFFYFLMNLIRNTNDNLPVLEVMQRYNAMLAATKCCAVDIRHTTKGHVDKEASELGMGSQQFRNSHRGQMVARYDPSPDEVGRIDRKVIVTDEKGSLLNPRGKPFAFRRKDLEIQFIRDEQIENPFMSPATERMMKQRKPDSSVEQCKVWLLRTLANCMMQSSAVIERAEDDGFKKDTVYTAKKEMGQIVTREEEPGEGQRGRRPVWWAIQGFDWQSTDVFADPFKEEPLPYDPMADE